ncbi:hypothetical protein [Candidatus Vampirococcus lugosii]|uniref:CHASE2 domain-containing protein n=1 Tax=Candidatus Vampirococcus lugosii TaxID=2789015 RepID=A0ABS5QKJ2_9BACT|nr:hypothetical protein [Candidatus Vampirococcus lugosii]MBS8121698.1 hypothetical protein [Candidatus Vampirococcus lugosii]
MEKNNNEIKKRIFVFLFLIIYLSSFLLNNFIFFLWGNVSAYTPKDTNNNLVAVLVDSDIYNGGVGNDIKRYAQNYIQGSISDSKAIIIPVNIDNFTAPDIVKILQNLYFEGQKDAPSSLIGTILIGDIPLPVVNNNKFIYPNIFPYVNFEKNKYVYDNNTGFFCK